VVSRRAARAGAAVAAAWPLAAAAHGDLERFGPFWAGALHPFLVPGHLLALLALGLWIGQRGLGVARHALVALLAGLTAGSAATLFSGWQHDTERALLLAGALAALAVVWSRPLTVGLLAALAGLVGAALAFGALPEPSAPRWARWTQAAGGVAGAFLAVAVLAALVDRARAPRARVGLRVLGSWLAAAALLVLALGAIGRPQPSAAGAAQSWSRPVPSAAGGAMSATMRPHDQYAATMPMA
jgi:urease accessory protein